VLAPIASIVNILGGSNAGQHSEMGKRVRRTFELKANS
jgi:hypothetical protein